MYIITHESSVHFVLSMGAPALKSCYVYTPELTPLLELLKQWHHVTVCTLHFLVHHFDETFRYCSLWSINVYIIKQIIIWIFAFSVSCKVVYVLCYLSSRQWPYHISRISYLAIHSDITCIPSIWVRKLNLTLIEEIYLNRSRCDLIFKSHVNAHNFTTQIENPIRNLIRILSRILVRFLLKILNRKMTSESDLNPIGNQIRNLSRILG
jgi:hypothetical protein